MPPKKASATGAAALQPLDPNQETLSLQEARSQKRKATSPTLQEDELDQEIRNMEMLHQQVQRKKEKMARLADLQRYTISLKMSKSEGPNTGSFIKKASSTRMNGMRISIVEILLLMMLLLYQQNYRLHLGPHLTSHPSSPCMTGTQIRSSFR
jgi:flagellar biosynthesis GTPase FlhF